MGACSPSYPLKWNLQNGQEMLVVLEDGCNLMVISYPSLPNSDSGKLLVVKSKGRMEEDNLQVEDLRTEKVKSWVRSSI